MMSPISNIDGMWVVQVFTVHDPDTPEQMHVVCLLSWTT